MFAAMNLPTREWFLLPSGFLLLVQSPAYSVERMMDLEKPDWSNGVTGKEKGVNAIT